MASPTIGPAAHQPVTWAVHAQLKTDRLEVAATGQDSAIRQTRRVETVSEASIYTLRDGRVSMHKLLSSPSTVLISV
tara:strand:+ start:434 stop:664 length:231 start_codon:yes stop_codon:yes gene_type:complete